LPFVSVTDEFRALAPEFFERADGKDGRSLFTHWTNPDEAHKMVEAAFQGACSLHVPVGDGTLPLQLVPVHNSLEETTFVLLVAKDEDAATLGEVLESEVKKTPAINARLTRTLAPFARTTAFTMSDADMPDAPLLYGSAAFFELTGYSSTEALGKNCRFLQGPATEPSSIEAIRTSISSSSPVTVRIMNYRKDGTPFVNELSLSYLTSGDRRYILGVQQDVTSSFVSEGGTLPPRRSGADGESDVIVGVEELESEAGEAAGGDVPMKKVSKRKSSRVEEQAEFAKQVEGAIASIPNDEEADASASQIRRESHGCIATVSHKVQHGFARFFYRLGLLVARHPWATIAIALVVAGAAGSGFGRLTSESRADRLWVPQGTEAFEDREFIEATFAAGARIDVVTLVSTGNILSVDGITTAFEYYDTVAELEGEYDGANYTWGDLCVRRGPTCQQSSFLSQFQYNSSYFESLNFGSDDDLYDWLQVRNISREVMEGQLGALEGDEATGRWTAASAMQFVYFLENRADPDTNEDPANEAWELEVLEYANAFDEDGVTAYPFMQRAFSDEFGSEIQGDIALIGVSYMLIFFYATVQVGRCSRRDCGATLGFNVIICVGLAAALGYGLCGYIGVPMSPIVQLLPFLLISLGVDDLFVIYSAVTNEPMSMVLEERIARAMEHAGLSIFITTFTDCIAFGLGLTSALPAVAAFSAFSSLSLFGVFLFQCTFMLAVVVLNERRRAANRMDVFCCFSAGPRPEHEEKEVHEPLSRRFFRDYYTPWLLSPRVRPAVGFLLVVMLSIFGWQATKVEEDSSTRSFIPSDSYLQDVFDVTDTYFPASSVPVTVVTKELDYYEQRDDLLSMQDDLKGTPYLQDPTVEGQFTSWITGYASIFPQDVPENVWRANLDVYLAGPGARYASDVVIEEGEIVASRFAGKFGVLASSDDEVAAMDAVRDACDELPYDAFAFAFVFIEWEGYKIIELELFRSLAISLVAIYALLLLLFANVSLATIALVCVLASVGTLLGLMPALGLPIDSVSYIQLVLSLGVSVDFTVHALVAYLATKDQTTRRDRTVAALSNTGGAILNGAISSLLGIGVLAFTSSYVFVVFFKMIFTVCLAAIFYTLTLVPLLLSTVGPMGDVRRLNTGVV
jgi:PAS domain S-box-containing protein